MKSGTIVGILVANLLASAAALAATVYTQPYDGSAALYASQNDTGSYGYGGFATVYDNFKLGANTTITGVEWTGGYFNPATPAPIAHFTIGFYADSSSQPGSLIASYTVAGNASETVAGNAYSYSGNVAFAAAAGTEYWMSIVPDMAFPPQWGWASGTGGDATSYQTFFGNRSKLSLDMAFSLSGSPSSVPDGGMTSLLLGGALVVLGLVRRKVS